MHRCTSVPTRSLGDHFGHFRPKGKSGQNGPLMHVRPNKPFRQVHNDTDMYCNNCCTIPTSTSKARLRALIRTPGDHFGHIRAKGKSGQNGPLMHVRLNREGTESNSTRHRHVMRQLPHDAYKYIQTKTATTYKELRGPFWPLSPKRQKWPKWSPNARAP